jgi:diguanylate cyclase (GGDEF)-like protein
VTFGKRLGLFFCLIVLVPLLALMLLVVFISEDSREGKADARLGASVETAFAVYEDAKDDGAAAGRALARDPALVAGLERDDAAALQRFARDAAAAPRIEAVEVVDEQDEVAASAGSGNAVAFGELALQRAGASMGTLRVSTTTARAFVAEVERLTGRQVLVETDPEALTDTVEAAGGPRLKPGDTVDLELSGTEYRGHMQLLDDDGDDTMLVLGPREEGGQIALGPRRAILFAVLLMLAIGLAYWLAKTLTQLHGRVATEAITDPLTGLFNRRRLHEALSREVDRALRLGHELALLIVDVDDFKSINDTRGHLVGDSVLRSVSGAVRRMTRSIDIGARYGGDELAVLVIETGVEGGERLAERIRAGVAETEVPTRSEGPVRVTVSIGVAAVPESATDHDGLMDAADQALLKAKRAGKNQIRTAPGAN